MTIKEKIKHLRLLIVKYRQNEELAFKENDFDLLLEAEKDFEKCGIKLQCADHGCEYDLDTFGLETVLNFLEKKDKIIRRNI